MISGKIIAAIIRVGLTAMIIAAVNESRKNKKQKEETNNYEPNNENMHEKEETFNLEDVLFSDDGEEDPFIKWCFGMSGPFAAMNETSCNKFISSIKSVTTVKWQEVVEENWQVGNREEAMSKIEEYIECESSDADHIISIINNENSEEIYKELLSLDFKEEFAKNASNIVPSITKKFKKEGLKIPEKTFKAWHLCKAAYLSLLSEAAGHITKAEVREYMEYIGKQSKKWYETWEEYTVSFFYYQRFCAAYLDGYVKESDEINEEYRNIYTYINSKKSVCNNISFRYEKTLADDLFPQYGEKDEFIKWCLGISGPMSAKNGNPCNTFEADFRPYTPSSMQKIMERDWGIKDRDDLLTTIDELINAGVDDYAEFIVVINEENSEKIYNFLCSINYKEELARKYSTLVPAVTKNFKKAGIKVPEKTLIAWDLVRAASLAQGGEAAGYINRGEAIDLMESAGKRANEFYETWEEYSAAFLYYRRMWIGYTGGYGEIADEIDKDYTNIYEFIHNSKSVCNNIDFKYKF